MTAKKPYATILFERKMIMNYNNKPKFHYRPQKGWINDPNGLVWFNGYFHIFYQHSPNFEQPWRESMHWGHARTKDFLTWEELPVALYPDTEYDNGGCWSGTAIVKDDILYLIYTSVRTPEGTDRKIQEVSVAYSKDGLNFTKYKNNPVINTYPAEGSSSDFRDPALAYIDGKYYCIIATGHKESKEARLLKFVSSDMFKWEYDGVMCSWENAKYCECPSFIKAENKYLLTSSVVTLDGKHYFSVMYGDFKDGKFTITHSAEIDKGPDLYAGQAFIDNNKRAIILSWIPGWGYEGFKEKDIGCMSLPKELTLADGKIKAYPIKEVEHLLKDSDPSVKITDYGFVVNRERGDAITYKGELKDLKILRDEYILEIFVNSGEEVYSILL